MREKVRDARLPEPGPVIVERDRQCNVRCECAVAMRALAAALARLAERLG